MKTITTIFLALATITLVQAQSFQLQDTLGNDISGTTLNVTNPGGDIYNAFSEEVTFKNISATTKNVKCKRVIVNAFPAAMNNYFCWVSCYGPFTNVSPTAETVTSNQLVKIFHGYVNPNGTTGAGTIRYVFYDEANVTDSVFVNINFTVTATTALKNSTPLKTTVSSIFPSPASTVAYLKINDVASYNNKKISLKIYNMLGKEVAKQTINSLQETIAIENLNDMPSGIYFVTLLADAKEIATKRLVIE